MMIQNDYISPASAASELGISEKTLNRWRQAGRGPVYIRSKDGLGLVRYSKAAVHEWRASQVASVSVRYLNMVGAHG